jgi:nucleotide-binding universal stress UspA family protein
VSGESDLPQRAPRPEGVVTTPGGQLVGHAVVLIGLDGSETSWDAFWWGCGEARRIGGQAVAAFVSPIAETGMAIAAAVGGAIVCDYTALDQIAGERATRLRSEAQLRAAELGLELAFVHARGDPAKELLRIGEALAADLIVVGRSTKARHQVAGSLGRRLIARRRAPVIVVVP